MFSVNKIARKGLSHSQIPKVQLENDQIFTYFWLNMQSGQLLFMGRQQEFCGQVAHRAP